MRDHASVRRFQRGELAKRTGCNLETVRYCEKIGLMPEPPRAQGGHRLYDTAHERWLQCVLRARERGFSLDSVRALLRLVDERDQLCAEARDLAADNLAEVQGKIADLKRMERVLKDAVAQWTDGTLPECPRIETLFREERRAAASAA